MTRINAFINPKTLTDQHLLAEYKEINQLCGQYANSLYKQGRGVIPPSFRLGTGHVSFFLDKGWWLASRFALVREEMIQRKFKTEQQFNMKVWDRSDFNHWCPKDEEIKLAKKLLTERISERILESKVEPRYYGKVETRESAVRRIRKNLK